MNFRMPFIIFYLDQLKNGLLFSSSKARIVLFLQDIKWILLFIARIAMRKFHILEGLNQL